MASRLISAMAGVLAAGWLAGCGTCPATPSRPFELGRDQLAFRNELQHAYVVDAAGRMAHRKTEPKPGYTLHCFPMVRAAREFFYHASFEPGQPPANAEECRRLVRAVIARDSRCPSALTEKIVIPGFASLAEFSRAHEALLKESCGSRWNSYTQRGNWRMVFPFSRGHQERAAESLRAKLERGLLPIIHVVDFPGLRINHALLLTNARDSESAILFDSYDPNHPEQPARIRFDRRDRRFYLEPTSYFTGGPVTVYEVYQNLWF